MIQFDLAQFKGPKFSLQDLSFDNRLTLPIGKIVPAAYWEVFPNEEFDCNVQQLTRFMPMPAPVMQRFDVFFDAHFVPYRLLKTSTFDSEKFFNLRVNDVQSPDYQLPLLTTSLSAQLLASSAPGTLADYLGIPSQVVTYRKSVEDEIGRTNGFADADTNEYPLTFLPSSYVSQSDLDSWNQLAPNSDDSSMFKAGDFTFSLGNDVVEIEYTFAGWIWFKVIPESLRASLLSSGASEVGSVMYYLTGGVYGSAPASTFFTKPNSDSAFWKAVKDYSGYSYEDLYNSYITYCCQCYFVQYLDSSKLINALPFLAFHRIIGDWYINSNFEDPDVYYQNHVYSYLDATNFDSIYLDLPNRYWSQDYFTSCFDSPQVGDAVRIPVNGTISDLRSANAFQKILERALYTGKRYIEQVRSFFGAKSSDARFDRTEVLGRKVFRMNINDVTQVNQADFDSLLTTPVGQVSSNAISVSGDHLFHYKSEEHGIIMVLMSIRPKASYMQGLPRLFQKRDVEDFLWPQYAQVGEQPVYTSELYASMNTLTNDSVFGFNRRYAEYMFHPSEVHGEFRSSMDYWHSARKFDSVPVLNTEFLKVTDKDQVERIFNYPENSGNVVSWIYFDTKVARALPRYINYDL